MVPRKEIMMKIHIVCLVNFFVSKMSPHWRYRVHFDMHHEYEILIPEIIF